MKVWEFEPFEEPADCTGLFIEIVDTGIEFALSISEISLLPYYLPEFDYEGWPLSFSFFVLPKEEESKRSQKQEFLA
jgi:hypothetical protein